MQEKRIELLERIRRELSGKTIYVAGPGNPMQQDFVQNLTYIASQNQMDFSVSEDLEQAGAGDYVFLAGGIHGEGKDSFDTLDVLLAQLEQVRRRRPASAVLISENHVYGKFFGDGVKRTEEMLGYVCHTSPADMGSHCTRTMEHLACRLAREEQLSVKTVRAEAGLAGDDLMDMILAALRVLLWGENGQVYNLPAGKAGETALTGTSPLTAVKVVTDPGKLNAQ